MRTLVSSLVTLAIVAVAGCTFRPPKPDDQAERVAADLREAIARELTNGDSDERVLAFCKRHGLPCLYSEPERSYQATPFSVTGSGRTDVDVRFFMSRDGHLVRSRVKVIVFFL